MVEPAEVEFEFALQDQQYRVIRKRQRRGKSGYSDLQLAVLQEAADRFREGVLRSDSSAFVLAERVRDRKTDTPIMSIVRVTATDTTSIIAAAIEDAMSTSLPVCGGVQLMLEPIFAEPPAWTAAHGIVAVAEAPAGQVGVQLLHGVAARGHAATSSNLPVSSPQAFHPGREVRLKISMRRASGSSCSAAA